MSATEFAIQQNRDAIKHAIATLDIIHYESVAKLLPVLLAQGKLKLDSSVYTPADRNCLYGAGRYLVYDHADQDHAFSVWVFVLAPRQKTSIHDHKYKGNVTVLDGPVTEKYFHPVDAHTARLFKRVDRSRFHTNNDDLDTSKAPFVHQLKRRKGLGPGVSVTLHIYDMAAHCIDLDGTVTDRRNLYRIYDKDRAVPKSDHPAYEVQYPGL